MPPIALSLEANICSAYGRNSFALMVVRPFHCWLVRSPGGSGLVLRYFRTFMAKRSAFEAEAFRLITVTPRQRRRRLGCSLPYWENPWFHF